MRVDGIDLVINVCNVHDKVNIIAKVIRHDTAEDVLCDVVPRLCQAFETNTGASPERTAHDPCAKHHKLWDRSYTTSQHARLSARTLSSRHQKGKASMEHT